MSHLFRRHRWAYIGHNYERYCETCLKFQRYTLINNGMQKIWLTFRIDAPGPGYPWSKSLK